MYSNKLLISEGGCRRIYDLFDGHILKIAKNKKGIIECSNEWYIYNNCSDKYKKFLCPIKDRILTKGEKTTKIIMNKVITAREYALKHRLQANEILNMIMENKNAMDAVFYLNREFDVDNYEILQYEFNWGFLGDTPVIIDYGSNIFEEILE